MFVPWVKRGAETLLLAAEVIGSTPESKEPGVQVALAADRAVGKLHFRAGNVIFLL